MRCRKSTKEVDQQWEDIINQPPVEDTTDERALSQMPDGGYFICPHCHTVYSMTRVEPGTAIITVKDPVEVERELPFVDTFTGELTCVEV